MVRHYDDPSSTAKNFIGKTIVPRHVVTVVEACAVEGVIGVEGGAAEWGVESAENTGMIRGGLSEMTKKS
jgi:hypothetical protein